MRFVAITSVMDLKRTPYKFELYSPCSKYCFCLMPCWMCSLETKLYLSPVSSSALGREVSTRGRWKRSASLSFFLFYFPALSCVAPEKSTRLERSGSRAHNRSEQKERGGGSERKRVSNEIAPRGKYIWILLHTHTSSTSEIVLPFLITKITYRFNQPLQQTIAADANGAN